MAASIGIKNCQRVMRKCVLLRALHLASAHCATYSLGHQNLWTASTLYRFSSSQHHHAKRRVYFFENTEEHCFQFDKPFQTVSDIKEFGVRTVKGGFRRRPELITQRIPDVEATSTVSKTYGLFDKCERIQQELTETTLRLMNVGEGEGIGRLMLDIGCGHGWSLTVPCLNGFCVTGIDIDLQALGVVQSKINSKYLPSQNTHVVRMDAANGLGFKENGFDVAISVSVLQWLCVGKHSQKILNIFFNSLQFVLKPGAKAGIQFYPRNAGDVYRVISLAEKYFKGVLVSDFPHIDRGRKLFLVLMNNK